MAERLTPEQYGIDMKDLARAFVKASPHRGKLGI